MAKKNKKKREVQKKASGVSTKTIVRIAVAVVLLVAIGLAIMDYKAKQDYSASFQAIGDQINNDGVAMSDLPGLLEGSPQLIGEPGEDDTVIYRWGVLRNHDMTLTLEGTGAGRVATRVE